MGYRLDPPCMPPSVLQPTKSVIFRAMKKLPIPETPPSTQAKARLAETRRDAHGFDPHDFEWYAVPRQPRSDGWTAARQRTFIEALADTGSVRAAAREADMSVQSCYRLRRAPDAKQFAAAWDAAIVESTKLLIDTAFDRALNGTDDPVLDKDGRVIYIRTKHNDRLLMFLLRAHNPGTYAAPSHRNRSHNAEPTSHTPCTPAFPEALQALSPAIPENSLALMHPTDAAQIVKATRNSRKA